MSLTVDSISTFHRDVNYPDMFMDGVGRHQSSFHSYSTFFEQAANGSLPHFSFVHPNDTWTDHPCNDVAKGERLTKDIYEALRAGAGWNKTLFAVLYDVSPHPLRACSVSKC